MCDFVNYRTLNAAGGGMEHRVILRDDRSRVCEKMVDKTLAEEDSFSVVSP